RIGGRNRFNLSENLLERLARRDQLFEIVLLTDLSLEVELLAVQLIFQLLDLAKRNCVLNSDRHLTADLTEKSNLIFRKVIFIPNCQSQSAELASVHEKRHRTTRLETGCAKLPAPVRV